MKKLFAILFVLLFASTSWAMVGDVTNSAEEEKIKGGVCPETKIQGKIAACTSCHTLKISGKGIVWGLKEVKPFVEFDVPYGTSFKFIDGEVVGWYDFTEVNANRMRGILEYYFSHSIKKMIINVDSFGGSAFDGTAIVSIIDSYIGKMVIETRLQSYGLSAGFLVFVAGHQGHRYIAPMATLMWHEIAYFAFIKKVTPSSSEQEAKIMRLLQTVANNILANRSNKTLEEINDEIRHKDWWMSGAQALEMGFADKLLK